MIEEVAYQAKPLEVSFIGIIYLEIGIGIKYGHYLKNFALKIKSKNDIKKKKTYVIFTPQTCKYPNFPILIITVIFATAPLNLYSTCRYPSTLSGNS